MQLVSLRLLLNLSFDGKIRSRIVELDIIPLLVSSIAKAPLVCILSLAADHRQGVVGVITCVLYHVSMDETNRKAFENGDILAAVSNNRVFAMLFLGEVSSP